MAERHRSVGNLSSQQQGGPYDANLVSVDGGGVCAHGSGLQSGAVAGHRS